MKLQEICKNIHFDNIKTPGTVVECITNYGPGDLLRGNRFEVSGNKLTEISQYICLKNLSGYKVNDGWLISRFKRVK